MENSVHSHVPGRKNIALGCPSGIVRPRPEQKWDASEVKAFSLQCLLPHSQALPNTLQMYHGKHISEASRWFQGCFPGVSQTSH